jgi:hypothetical protein
MDRRRSFAAAIGGLAAGLYGSTEEAKEPPARPNRRSASKASAEELRTVADDPKAARADRAAAVFALFANYLPPPARADGAAAALGDAGWLADARFRKVVVLVGWVPVQIGGGSSTYCLYLFPDKDGWSEWAVYLRLSGPDHSEADAAKFFRGERLKESPKLVEFALCYPSPKGKQHNGRVERFGADGLKVYDFDK